MKIIPLSSVEVRRRQRRRIDPRPLAELKESILTVGLLHPPVMWADGPKWILSVGERRLRAIQELNGQQPAPHFNCGEADVPPGHIPITPLGDYLDEVGRFEAELEENIRREEVPWQDRIQAMADLHAMRLAANPKQSLRDTAAELTERGSFAPKGEGQRPNPALASEVPAPSNTAKVKLSNAVTIARHLDNPAIAAARNESEALQLIYRDEEAKIQAELIRRQLVTVAAAPAIELKRGDLRVLLPILEAGRFDLVLGDPPYGIDVNSAGLRARTLHHHNYEDTPKEAAELYQTILTEGFRVTKPRANLFLFCDIDLFGWLKEAAAAAGWTPFRRPLIWLKSHSEGLAPWGSQGPRITTEFILFATKSQRGLIVSPTDVFDERRVSRTERNHGAEKPVELMKRLIEAATLPGDSVLDPCMGTGASMVAAQESKRLGFGIELAENYFNIALGRVHGKETSDVPEAPRHP